jgi:tRNA-dihydrouridine synthase B
MRLGSIDLSSPLCLAPLAGYTNLPFRLAIRPLGGLGLATTDLVNARSLLERKGKALSLVQTRPDDHPLAIQLFGSVAEEMRDAAQIAQELGADVIDINMGCPVRKVCKTGGGSAMMTDLDRTARLAAMMIAAVRIPVTAKMRLGWDNDNLTAPDLARALEDAGVAAITVHGRTREQGFGGRVRLDGIAAVVKAVRRVPVIGNGDLTSPEAARKMIQDSGCQGISIGRGAFYNPWIFHQTLMFLQTGQLLPEPGLEERIALMRRHLDFMVEVFGEKHACRMFRKVAPMYARRFGPAREFNRRVVLLSSRAEFEQILDSYRQWRAQFLEPTGELKPSYRPKPLPCSFLDSSSPDSEPIIQVPRGPVEYW